MENVSWQFILGIILITTNQMFGWGGVFLCIYLAKKTCNNIYYTLGTVIYALSWGMAFIGVLIAGPKGVELSKQIFKRYGWKVNLIFILVVCLTVIIWNLKRKRKPLAKVC